MREEAGRILTAARAAAGPDADPASHPSADPDAHADVVFDAQRLALSRAVRDHRLTEEVARRVIDDLDLRQAAHHTPR